MLFTVKIHFGKSTLARTIEADSSAAALKIGLVDFEKIHPNADVRNVSVSAMRVEGLS